jgi:hypothetical protein
VSQINLTGAELFLGGVAALGVTAMVIKARAGIKRARAAAEIARVGTSAVSIAGRVLLTAGGIVGMQWIVITYAATNTTLLLVVLAVPALFAAYTLTKALTVTEIRPSRSRGGARR